MIAMTPLVCTGPISSENLSLMAHFLKYFFGVEKGTSGNVGDDENEHKLRRQYLDAIILSMKKDGIFTKKYYQHEDVTCNKDSISSLSGIFNGKSLSFTDR